MTSLRNSHATSFAVTCIIVDTGWSWAGGVVLESDRGRLSWIVVRTKANEVLMTIFELA